MAEEGTFTNNEEVLRKAGPAASSTSSAEAYTNQYIKEVEGWIMAVLKKEDLKEKYSDQSDAVKELLRLASSNLAAIHVLQYDMSNYTNEFRAENQIQVLWSLATRAMELLEKILVKT